MSKAARIIVQLQDVLRVAGCPKREFLRLNAPPTPPTTGDNPAVLEVQSMDRDAVVSLLTKYSCGSMADDAKGCPHATKECMSKALPQQPTDPMKVILYPTFHVDSEGMTVVAGASRIIFNPREVAWRIFVASTYPQRLLSTARKKDLAMEAALARWALRRTTTATVIDDVELLLPHDFKFFARGNDLPNGSAVEMSALAVCGPLPTDDDVDGHLRTLRRLRAPTPAEPPEATWAATHGGHFAWAAGADPTALRGPPCEGCPFNGPDFCRPKEEGSIESLPRLSAKKRATLLALGVRTARDALVAHAEGKVKLTETQIAAAGGEGDVSVNPKFVEDWVKSLSYPVVALDFETAGFALPPWNQLRQYEAMPFQFSMRSYRKSLMDDEPVRYDFLHFGDGYDPAVDPRHSLGAALFDALSTERAAVGKNTCAPDSVHDTFIAEPSNGQNGTILAHAAAFEKRCMQQLGCVCGKEMWTAVRTWAFRDTIPFFRSSLRHGALQGSLSLKKILPIIFPTMSYSTIGNVQHGLVASAHYRLWQARKVCDASARDSLTRYCQMDVEGLVKAIRVMSKVCKNASDRSYRTGWVTVQPDALQKA